MPSSLGASEGEKAMIFREDAGVTRGGGCWTREREDAGRQRRAFGVTGAKGRGRQPEGQVTLTSMPTNEQRAQESTRRRYWIRPLSR